MPRQSKLELFHANPEKLKLYREGLKLMLQAGVEEVLLERACGAPIDPREGNATQLAAFAHQQSMGYQAAVYDLFNLDEIDRKQDLYAGPDFGARDKLKAQGYSDEQLSKLDKE